MSMIISFNPSLVAKNSLFQSPLTKNGQTPTETYYASPVLPAHMPLWRRGSASPW